MPAMQPFEPHTLPLTDLDWRQILPLVGQANAALARYDGLLASIPNPAVMLSQLTTQESALSSSDALPSIGQLAEGHQVI